MTKKLAEVQLNSGSGGTKIGNGDIMTALPDSGDRARLQSFLQHIALYGNQTVLQYMALNMDYDELHRLFKLPYVNQPIKYT